MYQGATAVGLLQVSLLVSVYHYKTRLYGAAVVLKVCHIYGFTEIAGGQGKKRCYHLYDIICMILITTPPYIVAILIHEQENKSLGGERLFLECCVLLF